MGISIRGGNTVQLSAPAEVIIDHTNDSIRLGDGTNLFTGTSKGGKIGLDTYPVPYVDAFEIVNLSIPLAATEVSQAVPAGTRNFLVKIRGGNSVYRVAFGAGETATKYMEFGRGVHWTSPDFDGASVSTIYLRTDKAAQVAEFMFFKCS